MNETETLEDFYRIKFSRIPAISQNEMGGFNVFAMEDTISPQGDVLVRYARRDFYKISLTTGPNLFHYADKSIRVEGNSLIFFNPRTPYKWEPLSKTNVGFFCIFKDAFFMEKLRGNLGELSMFAPGASPSYALSEEQTAFIADVFRKMISEMGSDYRYKQDLLVSYVSEIVHYAMKMEPCETRVEHAHSRSRITALFVDLLERQFPITSMEQRFTLRSARDFADQLFLHVNYLNNAIKETTGKTTSRLISERIAIEAKVMLKHTQWNISEVGYALGFEDASHFNNFFKKHTNLSPSRYRMS